MNQYKLSDDVITQIAKVIQIAILTGTDVVDNLRMVELSDDGNGKLNLSDDYKAIAESQIEKLLQELEALNDQESLEV
jgi:hypothetical protein